MMEFTDTSFFDLIFGIIADDLISFMFFGIMFFILLLAGIHEIKSFFRFFNMELAVTNKRVIGKSGIINTSAVDVPLDKIHSVSVSNGLFGKIFNYGNVVISMSTYETFRYQYISNPDEFKATLMEEIDRYKSAEEMDKKSAATEEN